MDIVECEVTIPGIFGYVAKRALEKKIKVKYGERATTICYIVSDPQTKEALVIDPGGEAAKIIKAAQGFKVKAVLVTHAHFPHATAVSEVAEFFDVPAFVHAADLKNFDKAIKHFFSPDLIKRIRPMKEGDKFDLGSSSLTVMHTPGHSPGSVCFYNAQAGCLFTGDTLFAGVHGAGIFEGSDLKEELKSLKRILALPPETRVFPGHGPKTTIGREQGLIDQVS